MEGMCGLQMCPVCTLYLRPGITLQDHLFTHPKDQVIEALVRLAATGPGVVLSGAGAATINTNSQFTAITYRQFQTLTSTPAVPESSVPVVLVNNPSSFTSSVIRSSVPLLPYPCYPPQQQQEQRADNTQTQCSYSFTAQTTQANTTVPTQNELSFTAPTADVTNELNEHVEELFLNGKPNNHEGGENDFDNDSIADVQDERSNDFIDCDKVENVEQKSEEEEAMGNVYQQTANFENQQSCNENIHEATFVSFMHERVDEEGQADLQEEPPTSSKSHESMIDTSHSLGTVISNTHRLIANDPLLDYEQEMRTEEINYREHGYGNLSSPHNIHSPVSDESNWSTSSGLRVRRDLNNLDESTNCIMYVQPNSSASEFVTSNPYDDDHAHHSSEVQLTNLDNVNYPLVLNYRNHQITNMDIACHVNKEDHSQETHLNIHSDELMPPRGELSGQESLGATENSVWELPDQDEVPSMSNTHLDKEQQWQILSNAMQEEAEAAFKKSHSVKCLECDMKFSCVKERRIHVQSEHKTPRHTQVKEETAQGELKLATSQIIKIKQERLSIKTEASTRTCLECNLVLQTVKELRKHRRECHEQKRRCPTCETVFEDHSSYKEHIANIHPIECTVCGKFFTTKSAANTHRKTHLKQKPFQCSVCDKSFVSRVKLTEHNNIHSGESPYKCTMCEQSFKRQSNLIQHKNCFHLKIKRKVKDYFCHCGEIFHSIKKLQWHKETHDTKPKQCMYCSERYIHSTSLTRHIRHAHDSTYLPKATRSLNILCPVCKITCIRTSLAQHMKIHKGDKPFNCNVCSKEFSTNWNLQMHKWTHASRNSKPYKCKQCKCAFYMQSSYQAHLRSHRNIRPYTCNYCGRQFIRKYNCVRHVKEHETTKSYCCAVCNKTFHRSYYLTEHMRTHTGVKPFTCHICSKTSSTKSNHNKHLRTHHAREPVNTEG